MKLDMFNLHPDLEDDTERNCYVYAWYTKTNPKHYFYIGKGKRNRYQHILSEIATLEKNPRKYKAKPYKILQDKYGINVEFLYQNLTAKEASVMEAYTIMQYLENKEPLLNAILPAGVMNNKDLMTYRDSYYYAKSPEAFLQLFGGI